ncbi:MAG: HAUS augmin-like complex subunit 6 N-terminus-domain-containing protein [Benjaminiella poitrasii]|nr:MAG: HAUS augmin-like complex subunit 6 N-terminus-domain-containing protein [Benjaminiella poitrasii]
MFVKTLLSNLKVLGYDQQVHGDETFILDEHVFTKGANNSKAFQHISHFLFRQLDKRRVQREFHDCWPVTSLKQANMYVQVAHKWLTELRDECPILSHVPLRKSQFIVCHGEMMNKIMMAFSTAVLSIIVKKQMESKLDYYKRESQEKGIELMTELHQPQRSTIDINHETMLHVKRRLETIRSRLQDQAEPEQNKAITSHKRSSEQFYRSEFMRQKTASYSRQRSASNGSSYSQQSTSSSTKSPIISLSQKLPSPAIRKQSSIRSPAVSLDKKSPSPALKRTPIDSPVIPLSQTSPSFAVKRKSVRSPSPSTSPKKKTPSPRVSHDYTQRSPTIIPTTTTAMPSRRVSQQSPISTRPLPSNETSHSLQDTYCCTLRKNMYDIMTRSQPSNDYYVLPALTFSSDEELAHEESTPVLPLPSSPEITFEGSNEPQINRLSSSPQQQLCKRTSVDTSHSATSTHTSTIIIEDEKRISMIEHEKQMSLVEHVESEITDEAVLIDTEADDPTEERDIPKPSPSSIPSNRLSVTEEPVITRNKSVATESPFRKPYNVSNDTSRAISPTLDDWASVDFLDDERPPDYFDAGLFTPFRR